MERKVGERSIKPLGGLYFYKKEGHVPVVAFNLTDDGLLEEFSRDVRKIRFLADCGQDGWLASFCVEDDHQRLIGLQALRPIDAKQMKKVEMVQFMNPGLSGEVKLRRRGEDGEIY